ncbi:MAG TPA: hypothetical protein VKA95_02885 [Nitrososphaeraceae archaeon]|nr:hypothetical protein [Nitrososphaeraceae archaeon]
MNNTIMSRITFVAMLSIVLSFIVAPHMDLLIILQYSEISSTVLRKDELE